MMSYSVKPEIKYKPKEVEERFRVWKAGGHILAVTNKADAERIVDALNRDELFGEMEKVIRRQVTHGINQCSCHWHPSRKCNACKREAILAKIDALKA